MRGEGGGESSGAGEVGDGGLVVGEEEGAFCAEEAENFGVGGEGEGRSAGGEAGFETGRGGRERFLGEKEGGFGGFDFGDLVVVVVYKYQSQTEA